MDIQALLAFVHVAQSQSFSSAAESLHLSQPAVSKRISGLESYLNTQLFDRIARKVTLTEPGRLLLPKAKRILAEVEDAKRSLSRLSGRVEGTLRIGTSHHIGLHHLPSILRVYTTQYPAVKLDIQFVDSEQAYDQVLHGTLELGFLTLPPEPARDLNARVIWEDPLSFVTGTHHPLSTERGRGNSGRRQTLNDLSRYPAILPGESTFTRRIVEETFRAKGLGIDVGLSTNYLETIKMMVSIGLGWSVLPSRMMDSSLVTLETDTPQLSRNLGCVYHPRHSLSNAAEAMLTLVLNGESGKASC